MDQFNELLPPENPITAAAQELVGCFNNIVDSKLSTFSAPSTLSPVAIDASNPPFSITETILASGDATIYFLIDASQDDLMQHLSTPIQINCHVATSAGNFDFTIRGTLNDLVANSENLPYESYVGNYIDDRDIKHRAVILRPVYDSFPNDKILSASGEFVWGSLPVQALETTIDGTVYQIPLLARIAVLEQAFQEANNRLKDFSDRLFALEKLANTPATAVVGDGDDEVIEPVDNGDTQETNLQTIDRWIAMMNAGEEISGSDLIDMKGVYDGLATLAKSHPEYLSDTESNFINLYESSGYHKQ